MAKFPTYEEMGKKVAEEALDGFVYKGKTLREWIDILSSSEIPNKCEDAISRQAVLTYIERILTHGMGKKKSFEFIKKFVEKLPSVTPKQKMGHWIGHREHCEELGVMPSGLGAYEWCSNCDCGIDVKEWHRNNYNYCPNCGAKMQEVEE